MENNKKKIIIVICLVIAILVTTIGGVFIYKNKPTTGNNGDDKKVVKRVDDWKYDDDANDYNRGGFLSGLTNSFSGLQNSVAMESAGMAMDSMAAAPSANLGFSVGGAKDINNFRENIENGYFPISTDITYNGLFYDYTFDTGMVNESEDLFSPSYSLAVSKDPVSNEKEYYMTVGLNSNIKESDFQRKKLNLVVVLDISGSMGSSLDRYYYDDPFASKDIEHKSKMQAANEAVNILLDQLKDDDRFGMVLFDDSAYLAKELSLVEATDMDAIKEHILEITEGGGTNFEAGYTKATKLFDELKNVDSNEYENRIIVITDAMPNYGTTSKEGLFGYVNQNADDGIYTTFIGVGVDFNTKLIETISDVKGANYYSVHTVKEFEERMGEQFEFMVTPLVFDLELNLESEDYKIASVYGSDTVDKENGNIMSVNTLFPSKSVDGEVKGGVILLKLEKVGEAEEGVLKLNVSYKDRNGEAHANSQEVKVQVASGEEDFYANTGIRKAIALTRYANTMKNWILYERSEERRFLILPVRGIMDCECMTVEEVRIALGEHERTSVKLSVSEEYEEVFEKLKTYLEAEIEAIGDKTLEKETQIIELLQQVK